MARSWGTSSPGSFSQCTYLQDSEQTYGEPSGKKCTARSRPPWTAHNKLSQRSCCHACARSFAEKCAIQNPVYEQARCSWLEVSCMCARTCAKPRHLLALECVVACVQEAAVAQALICPGVQHFPARTSAAQHGITSAAKPSTAEPVLLRALLFNSAAPAHMLCFCQVMRILRLANNQKGQLLAA